MSRQRQGPQLELPVLTAQQRSRYPERAEFYAEVLRLRAAGHRVYRGGRSGISVVDGEYRSNIARLRAGRRRGR